MKQEYVVETTPDGRLQLRLVLVPDEDTNFQEPVYEAPSRVIVISPDDDDSGAIIIENM